MKSFRRVFKDGLYRSRNGVILGVCRGCARYLDVSVFWTRVVAVCLLVFTGFWPTMIVYFGLALLMKPEPAIPIMSGEEQEFYDNYVHSRRGALDRMKRRYRNLDRRIRRMENTVTSREFDWDERLNT